MKHQLQLHNVIVLIVNLEDFYDRIFILKRKLNINCSLEFSNKTMDNKS